MHQVNAQLTPRRARPGLGAPSYAVVYFWNSSGQWQQVYAGDWGQAQAVGGEYIAAGNPQTIAYVYDDVTQQWRIWDFGQNAFTANNSIALAHPAAPGTKSSIPTWKYAAFAGLLVVVGGVVWYATE